MDRVPVLIVDDDASIQLILEEALEDAGFSVTARANGEDAIGVLEEPDASYAALVTDIELTLGGQPDGTSADAGASSIRPWQSCT